MVSRTQKPVNFRSGSKFWGQFQDGRPKLGSYENDRSIELNNAHFLRCLLILDRPFSFSRSSILDSARSFVRSGQPCLVRYKKTIYCVELVLEKRLKTKKGDGIMV